MQARKTALVKLVISPMPVYAMATNEIPRKVCMVVDKKARDIIWSKKVENSRGFSKIAWKKICHPKRNGGLGIQRLT